MPNELPSLSKHTDNDPNNKKASLPELAIYQPASIPPVVRA